jgi:hypothetical protein
MIEWLMVMIFIALMCIASAVDSLKQRIVTIAEWREQQQRIRENKDNEK